MDVALLAPYPEWFVPPAAEFSHIYSPPFLLFLHRADVCDLDAVSRCDHLTLGQPGYHQSRQRLRVARTGRVEVVYTRHPPVGKQHRDPSPT